MKVVILGTAHPFRGGGITTFNHRLAKAFLSQGHQCSLLSFSLQYPSFLFPGKSQYTNEPPPEGLVIRSWINSVNPLNWIKVGRLLQKERPDLVIVRFWIPFMGPSFGTILRLAKRNKHTKVICIADNVIPHEKRPGDALFTRYFIKACDAFLTMSEKVMTDLRSIETRKPAQQVPHPLYDNFGTPVSKTDARKHLNLVNAEKLLLFFGFIRKYKGLDLLLEAMADPRIREKQIKLLVAGEFYEDEKPYLDLIKEKGLNDTVLLKNHFIPDKEVRYYLSAADCVVQPYRNATQSGVTPLSYHFEKPMIVTNVGGLPSLVTHLQSGIVCESNSAALADAIIAFYNLGDAYFHPSIIKQKQLLSWEKLIQAIQDMYAKVGGRL